MKSFLSEILITLGLAVLIFVGLQTTVQSFIVVGSSMNPSLEDGERLLVNKVSYRLGQPHRGDIVVFQPPTGQRVDFIKRVIGLPGETVEVRGGVVYINGNPLSEPYIEDTPGYTVTRLKVPSGEYFVLGDNRNNSNDSHNGWTVPRRSIIGKAWLLIWPPSRWGVASSYFVEQQMADLNAQPASLWLWALPIMSEEGESNR